MEIGIVLPYPPISWELLCNEDPHEPNRVTTPLPCGGRGYAPDPILKTK
jgi:hypothetical protein